MENPSIFKKVRSKLRNLEQGDLLLNLVIPVTTVQDASSMRNIEQSVRLDWNTGNFVILTQSCDLDPDNDKQISSAVLAPVLTVSSLLIANPYYRKADRLKSILQNKKQNFYCVPPPAGSVLDNGELLVIALDSPVIVQLDLITMQVTRRGSTVERYRMASPYSEDLSNVFAYQFERVPLPVRVFPPVELQTNSFARLAVLRDADFQLS
jgi:hypothetical protein